jgi:hypothetical protein
MKSVLISGLAALLLSSGAMAQNDWSYLHCNYQQWPIHMNRGTVVRDSNQSTGQTENWRVRGREFERFLTSSQSWVSFCNMGADFRQTHFHCRHEARGEGGWQVSIGRADGRWESLWFSGPELIGFAGEGRCTPGSNPLGGKSY